VASAGLRASGVRSTGRAEDAVAGVGRAGAEALARVEAGSRWALSGKRRLRVAWLRPIRRDPARVELAASVPRA